MPYGGIEPRSEYERIADQAAHTARELAKEQREQFVRDYRTGRLLPSPFPNLAPINGVFETARREQELPVLSDEQRTVCAELVAEARVAIREADVKKLRFALGPDFYNHRRDYTEATRANYWEYLSCLIKLAIVQRREAVMLEFASENGYPEKLNPMQQENLRMALVAAFNQEDQEDQEDKVKKFQIPRDWNIDEPFLVMAKK